MIYADEAHAEYYAKNTTGMVKALISVFEDWCFEQGMIVYLLEVIHPHTVSVYVTPVKQAVCYELQDRMNEAYKRLDKMWTCQLFDEKEGSFVFFGTDDRKLKNLN